MENKLMEMLFFILCTSIGSMFAFNHTCAAAECIGNGGLASFRHFTGDTATDVYNAEYLKEGESAWISGYVNFSKFVAYFGCYRIGRDSVHKYTLQENNIYNCLQNCSRIENITYIGLRNKICYCVNTTDLVYFNAKPDNDCNPELINSNIESSPSVSEKEGPIIIYRIIYKTFLFWDPPFSEAHGQCVRVRSDGKATIYQTDSCYSKAASFICTKSVYRYSLYGQCGLQNTTFCIISESNFWMTSFKECLECKGKLINFVSTKMKGNLSANKSYWTGIFRTFKIENKTGLTDNNVCLSIKKVNDKIYFDPEDCSTEKKFICEDKLQKETVSSSIKTTVDTKTNSVSLSSFPTTTTVEHISIASTTKPVSLKTISPTQTKIEEGKSDLIGVYITVGVVFVVVLSFIIICFILWKRKQLKATVTRKRRISKDHGMPDNTSRGSDVEQRQDLAYQSVEDEVTYAKPDTALKKISSPDGEYDRIRVKGIGERKENTSKAKTIDNHVYGINSAHPIDIDIEVYDHLEAARKTNVSKPNDGIYNTLTEDSDTYNVLGHGNKEDSTKFGVNRTQIKETCPTYDKLE